MIQPADEERAVIPFSGVARIHLRLVLADDNRVPEMCTRFEARLSEMAAKHIQDGECDRRDALLAWAPPRSSVDSTSRLSPVMHREEQRPLESCKTEGCSIGRYS